MRFSFSKPSCQNIRRSLRKEWIQTNGLGDYSSGTVSACNTRKYHGLLIANLSSPPGRHVLLSTLEESVYGDGKEFFFSTRKHPGVYYPRGYDYQEYMEQGNWTVFRYTIGPLNITKELVLVQGSTLLLIKYTADLPDGEEGLPQLYLRVRPQLAYRHMHNLAKRNDELQSITSPAGTEGPGFSILPYSHLPPLVMQTGTDTGRVEGFFRTEPDWCMNVEYFMEEERGFPFQEDLFNVGLFEIPLQPGKPIYLSAGIEELHAPLHEVWAAETARRSTFDKAAAGLMEHLRKEGRRFFTHVPEHAATLDLLDSPQGTRIPRLADDSPEHMPAIVAGYHWFNAWGRDSLIALPGLTFASERGEEGKTILAAIGKACRHGLVPNLFAFGDSPPAYNSVDASLWYIWAVQQLLEWMPDEEAFVREYCWPVIKDIVTSYMNGGPASFEPGFTWPPIWMDEQGLIHAGNEQTQLTWMDANAYGRPVTPRHGCPVEINAMWYNALAFTHRLAAKYREPQYDFRPLMKELKGAFKRRFWTLQRGGYLGDVWEQGHLDTSIRPNQIFAVSMPFSILDEEDQASVVECVRNNLLTPYGLRTLSPLDPAYKGVYEGGPDQRDSAYHQGTVWPWPLGAYGEAMLKVAWDVNGAVEGFLNTISPLFAHHLGSGGLGSISEIFNGNPPHWPQGCIAQAWSVAEPYRMLQLLRKAAPEVFAAWEARMDREVLCAF